MPRHDVLRAALAQEIGAYGRFTTTAVGTTTTLVCTSAFLSSELPASSFAYEWVLITGGSFPRQRRITAGGLNGTTSTITVEGVFPALVASGTAFELLGPLPAYREWPVDGFGQTQVMGIRECLNAGLRHILVPNIDSTSVTIVNNQHDYTLPTWIDRPERLLTVRQRNATGTDWVEAATHGHRWEIREDVDGLILHFFAPYRTSGTHTLQLQAMIPADTWINGAVSTTGLVQESDTCGSDVNAIVAAAKPFAYAALRDSRNGPAKARYQAMYEAAVRDARKVRNYDRSNDIDASVPAEVAA